MPKWPIWAIWAYAHIYWVYMKKTKVVIIAQLNPNCNSTGVEESYIQVALLAFVIGVTLF